MQVSLLTPAGALVALVTLVPLAALALSEARARRVRAALGLGRPRNLLTLLLAVAVAVAGALVGAAAAQPVLERGTTRSERTDVNAYVLIDATRSMLAASAPEGPSRMARARTAAQELRAVVPDLKVGLASFTDRVLPHVFPTLDEDVYAATLANSIGIERPPPSRRRRNATDLGALQQLGAQGYFPATPERRIVVVLSDFETDPFSITKLGAALRRQRLEAILVHVWDGEERIFGGLGDAEYRPDPASVDTVGKLARAAHARAFSESELDSAKTALRSLLGDGASRPLWEERSRTELAPWLSLAAIVPLGFILWRRNLA
jgi:hypothetical protein